MRGDQPVVSAASWMVRASTRPDLTTLLSRFRAWTRPRPQSSPGLRGLGREEDRLAVLVLGLVEPYRGEHRRVGVLQAPEHLVERHRVVALPRRLDVDLGPRPGGGAAPGGPRLARALARGRRLAARGA